MAVPQGCRSLEVVVGVQGTARGVAVILAKTMTPDRIRAIRAALRLSTNGLAIRLGVSRQAVNRYETDGVRIPQTIEVAMRTVQRERGEELRANIGLGQEVPNV